MKGEFSLTWWKFYRLLRTQNQLETPLVIE